MWFWKVSFPLNGTMIFSILILYATSIGAVKSDLWKETTLIEKVNEKSKRSKAGSAITVKLTFGIRT
jgi:hypothetical protein